MEIIFLPQPSTLLYYISVLSVDLFVKGLQQKRSSCGTVRYSSQASGKITCRVTLQYHGGLLEHMRLNIYIYIYTLCQSSQHNLQWWRWIEAKGIRAYMGILGETSRTNVPFCTSKTNILVFRKSLLKQFSICLTLCSHTADFTVKV